ncbi:hypothetical protein [Streptomyces sp. NPDC001970]
MVAQVSRRRANAPDSHALLHAQSGAAPPAGSAFATGFHLTAGALAAVAPTQTLLSASGRAASRAAQP